MGAMDSYSGRGAAAPAGRSGFTLLELMLMIAVLTIIMGGVFTVVFRSQISFGVEVQQFTIDQTGRRILERLSREIREAYPPSILPLSIAGASQIQFQRVIGYKDRAPVLGPVMTLGFQVAPGETANGLDDNKDGRVDEGFITYTVTGGPPIAFAGNVQALAFTSTPFGMAFSLVVALVDRDGRLVQKTFSQQVSYRN